MRPSQAALVAIALAALLCATSVMADGFIIVQPPPDQPNWRGVPLAVNFHHVDVKIDNQLATTVVEQEFKNPNNMQIEGLYIFPLPVGASVSDFSMWIDGKEMQAELLDREKASEIYENIVRQTRDPALLEYMGTRLFKLRIFPIAPNENKKIKLEYSEVVPNDGGMCTYRYPLNTEKFSSAPLQSVVVRTEIASKTPIRNVFSPSHDVDVARKNEHSVIASYERNNLKPDKDYILYYTLSEEDLGLNLVTWRRPGEDGYFMLLANPSAETPDGEHVQKDVAFVVDVSGSMVEGDKIAEAKSALKFCVQSLGTGDRFNVIAFSTEARPFRPELVDFDPATRDAALAWIDGLKARGGTNIDEALQLALQMGANTAERPYMVVFMTDGQPTIGQTTNPDEIFTRFQAGNKTHARVFSLGVGYDVNTGLLDRLAEANKGTREYITPEENLELKVSSFYAKVANPALSDIKVALDGIETYDVYPKSLPDLFRGTQMVVFGRFRGEGHHAVRLGGNVNGKSREYVYEADFAAGSPDTRSALPRLWAIRKIAHLLDAIRLHGENAELESEVVALAKEFGVITPYTSFLVLEDMQRRGDDAPAAPAERTLRGRLREEREKLKQAGEDLSAQSGAGAVGASKAVKDMAESTGGEADESNGFFFAKDKEGKADGGDSGRSSLVRTVNDRTFYQADGIWSDSRVKSDDGKRVRVKYLEAEYFELLRKIPALSPFLALGARVVVEWEGTVYEVTE